MILSYPLSNSYPFPSFIFYNIFLNLFRDLEEQQELSEELDQQQRADLDLIRKELNSTQIQLYDRDTIIQ